MKIAYILYWVDGVESGVFRKVLNQIRFWTGAGHDVMMLLAGPVERQSSYQAAVESAGAKLEYFPVAGAIGRWMRWRRLKRFLRLHSFSVIYHRFDLATPGLTAAMQSDNWVVEINTNDVSEYNLHPGLRAFYNRISRTRHFSRASASVFPTRELAENPVFAPLNSARAVIANGADFSKLPQLPPPNPNAPVELLFMGSDGHSWHGVDKLADLAAARPDWKIHAVGVSGAMFPNGKPPNIVAPGKMAQRDYEPLARSSIAGIGTLGLHRKAMHEACPLKVREYLAYGLPVILGYIDTDIPQQADYAVHIPNIEDNVVQNRERIISFVESWRGRRVAREQIAHMDWAAKEKARLDFMARFVKK